jgi:hypothetical protein
MHSWRAEEQVLKLRNLIAQGKLRIQIKYANRQHLVAPHNLANLARRVGYQYKGTPIASFMAEHGITHDIDRQVLKIVHDDGG